MTAEGGGSGLFLIPALTLRALCLCAGGVKGCLLRLG